MKEEKRKSPYLDPEIKIVAFEAGDVIATSGEGKTPNWSDDYYDSSWT